MNRPLVDMLALNFQQALAVLRDSIGNFSDEQWRRGISEFQVPAKVAYHTVECLDCYFTENQQGPFPWGRRFGFSWWERGNAEQPDQGQILEYLQELEERIEAHFAGLDDDALQTPFDDNGTYPARLGHYTYALRHTMHHHGSLVTLAIHNGAKPGEWT